MKIFKKMYFLYLRKRNRMRYAQMVYEERINLLRHKGMRIGEKCRIENAKFGSEPYLIEIGNHVTVGANVQFVTHDGGVWVLRGKYPNIDYFGKIIIGDNCFIGINSIIMPNVIIGKNTIIAAGSIVTKNVDENTIVAGVPAKKINELSNYEQKMRRQGVNTKGLNYNQKKKYLINYFDNQGE